jgi:hypothetical protein
MKKPRYFEWVRVGDHWELRTPGGRNAATVWDNGTWHTWDRRGVGMENEEASTPERAKWIAYCSVLGQRQHGLYRLKGFHDKEGL